MMVTASQMKKGVREYAVDQLFPRYRERSVKRFVIGSLVDLLCNGLERPASGGVELFLSMSGLKDKDGLYDVDLLREVLNNNMPDEGTYDEFDFAGFRVLNLSFGKKDVDALVRHIMNA